MGESASLVHGRSEWWEGKSMEAFSQIWLRIRIDPLALDTSHWGYCIEYGIDIAVICDDCASFD